MWIFAEAIARMEKDSAENVETFCDPPHPTLVP